MAKFEATVGDIIDRTALHANLGGRTQSRISSVRNADYMFLFIDPITEETAGMPCGIAQDGFLHAAGEGLAGDQRMKNGNLMIINHAAEGKALHCVHQGRQDEVPIRRSVPDRGGHTFLSDRHAGGIRPRSYPRRVRVPACARRAGSQHAAIAPGDATASSFSPHGARPDHMASRRKGKQHGSQSGGVLAVDVAVRWRVEDAVHRPGKRIPGSRRAARQRQRQPALLPLPIHRALCDQIGRRRGYRPEAHHGSGRGDTAASVRT